MSLFPEVGINEVPYPTKHGSLRGSMDRPLSIAEITDLIKLKLESDFAEVVIVGEISNFKAHPSGHFYFSLKDEKASLSAVMFRGGSSKIKFKVRDGLKVIAIGRISVYPPRGNYQIILTRLEPEGLGALQLAFEQLKKKLELEGLFALERKRLLPKFPRALGIVTSSSGAAIQDILQILERRFAGLPVLIYPVKVQGPGSAEEIAEAILHLNRHFKDDIDVLIVGRGGGSIEDLWAFNEEIVARAIFNSLIPIISAVGHEVDFTIADFVADLRAPTPSAAAELVISSKWEIIQHLDQLARRLLGIEKKIEFYELRLDDLQQRLFRTIERRVSDSQLRLERLRSRLLRFSPDAILESYRGRLTRLSDALDRWPVNYFQKKSWQVEHASSKLKLLSPRAIMDRGYSIVRVLETKKLVKKAADVRMGDKLLIELGKGRITAKV